MISRNGHIAIYWPKLNYYMTIYKWPPPVNLICSWTDYRQLGGRSCFVESGDQDYWTHWRQWSWGTSERLLVYSSDSQIPVRCDWSLVIRQIVALWRNWTSDSEALHGRCKERVKCGLPTLCLYYGPNSQKLLGSQISKTACANPCEKIAKQCLQRLGLLVFCFSIREGPWNWCIRQTLKVTNRTFIVETSLRKFLSIWSVRFPKSRVRRDYRPEFAPHATDHVIVSWTRLDLLQTDGHVPISHWTACRNPLNQYWT